MPHQVLSAFVTLSLTFCGTVSLSSGGVLQRLLESYESHMLPPDESGAVRVELELGLMNIQKMDFKEQTITVHAKLRQGWNDSRLTWSPTQDVPNKFTVQEEDIWTPQVILVNSANGEPPTHSVTVVNSSGYVLRQTTGLYSATCPMDVEYYPYDTQRCQLTFQAATGGQLNINLDLGSYKKVNLNEYMMNAEWWLLDVPGKTVRYYNAETREHVSTVKFDLILRRRGVNASFKVVPPLLLLILGLIVMLMPPTTPHKIIIQSLAFVGLIGLLIYTFNGIAGGIITTPLLVKIILAMTLLLMFAIIVSVLTVLVYMSGGHGRPLPTWLRTKCIRRLMTLLCVGSNKPKGGETGEDHHDEWMQLCLMIDRIMFACLSLISLIVICILCMHDIPN